MSETLEQILERMYAMTWHDTATIRDHYAGLAMQSYLSRPDCHDWGFIKISTHAFAQADAMVKARNHIELESKSWLK